MRQPAIYVIRNSVTGRCYIGSSINPRKRWNEHRSALNNRRHENSHLQRAWWKYGADAFSFTVAEYVDDESQLATREQAQLEQHRPMVYNIGTSTETPWRGQKFSPEHRAALVEAWKVKRQKYDMGKTARKIAARKAVSVERAKSCANGHIKTDTNFFINSKGWKMCLDCRAERYLKRADEYTTTHVRKNRSKNWSKVA